MVVILPGPPLPGDPLPPVMKPNLAHRVLIFICSKCKLCKVANGLHKLLHKKDDFQCYKGGSYRLTKVN